MTLINGASLLIILGAVPGFTQTSSPELDRIFARFRQKVFLPAHLSKAQRDLVFKPKYKKSFTAEPIIASIAGEEFCLEHIDKCIDIPNAKKVFPKILDLMQDKRDWDNLPRFLTGLHQAGRNPAKLQQFIMVRKAAEAGRLDVILECARRVSETGFALKDPSLVNKFVRGIQNTAMTSDWEVSKTKKALSWVEIVSVMLEDKRHAGGRVISSKDDPRTNPELVGILLELSAIRAARHLGGQDEGGKVAEYARRLLGLNLDLKPMAKSADNPKDVYNADQWLYTVIPIVHGMKVAETILDSSSETAKRLKQKKSELEGLVSQEREFVINDTLKKDFYGIRLYDKLLAEESA